MNGWDRGRIGWMDGREEWNRGMDGWMGGVEAEGIDKWMGRTKDG